MPKRKGLVKRVRNWEYGGGKFDTFHPKGYSEFRKEQKKASKWLAVCIGVTVVSLGVVVYETSTGSSEINTASFKNLTSPTASTAPVGKTVTQGTSEKKITDASGLVVQDDRQEGDSKDKDVPRTPTDYITTDGKTITATYDPHTYTQSMRVSNRIAAKYGVPFTFYPRIGDNLYGTPDGHAFTAVEGLDLAVDDNFYLLQGIGGSKDMQRWYDDLGYPLYAHVDYHNALLHYGVDFHDVSAITRDTGGDVLIVIPADSEQNADTFANDFGRYITKGMVEGIGGDDEQLGSAGDLSKPLNLTLVVANDDSFLASGTAPDMTAQSAPQIMGGSYKSSISYKVDQDGTAKRV